MIRSHGQSPHERDSDPYKRDPTDLFGPFCLWGWCEGKRALTRPWIYQWPWTSQPLQLWEINDVVYKSPCLSFCNSSQNGLREGLIKTQVAGSHLGVSGSVGLAWGQKSAISNKFPSDASSSGTSLWDLLWKNLFRKIVRTWSPKWGGKPLC